MRVYKFGGASVKDAAGVQNVLRVLRELEASETVVVISAMGKMTNAFESVVQSYFGEQKSLDEQLESIRAFVLGASTQQPRL